MTDRIGQQLGNYRLIRPLGKGSFADVYLAEHIHLESLAAIKILQVTLSEEHKAAFLTEARRLVRLKHTNIIRLLEFGIEGDVPFLVMEYASNGSLRTRHPKGTRVPLETVVFYVKQIADALQYIHEQKLVHRDIKPENILLGANQEVLVSDLGIAAVAHSTGSIVPQGDAGTLLYMAPEQMMQMPRPASDQYSLGIVVYEWLCGSRPFYGSLAEIYHQQLLVPPPSLREKIPELSPAVEEVVLKALAKDPLARFSTIQEFATALEQASQFNAIHPSLPAFVAVEATPSFSTPTLAASMIDPGEETIPSLPAVSRQVPTPISRSPFITAPLITDAHQENSDSQLAHPTREAGAFATFNVTPANRHDKKTQTLSELGNWPVEQPQHGAAWQRNDAISTRNTGNLVAMPATNYIFNGNNSNVGTSQPKTRRRLITILLLLIVIVAISALSLINPIKDFILSTSHFTVVKVTTASTDLKNTYIISAVTGKPDVSKQEVQARFLSFSIPPQSKTVGATGLRTIPGVQASGKLTFYNGSVLQETVAAGTTFTDANGVQVVNDEIAVIPAAKPPTEGSVSVAAHAVNAGMSGNIKALDIHKSCCITGDFILVENLSPFSGGKDEQQLPFVQQSDIDNVVAALTQQARASLRSQVRSNEQLAYSASCTSKASSNHGVGARVSTVTVTASVSCTSEVYDQQAAETLAANQLKSEAIKSLGRGYTLSGKIVTTIKQVKLMDANNGTLYVLVEADGKWVSH